jgi:hypothetical protein
MHTLLRLTGLYCLFIAVVCGGTILLCASVMLGRRTARRIRIVGRRARPVVTRMWRVLTRCTQGDHRVTVETRGIGLEALCMDCGQPLWRGMVLPSEQCHRALHPGA